MNDYGKRYIGLDVHKLYLIALGVDEELQVVLPARQVELAHLETCEKEPHARGCYGVGDDDQHPAVVR